MLGRYPEAAYDAAMLIVFRADASEEQRNRVLALLQAHGLEARWTEAGARRVAALTGEVERVRELPLALQPGVERVVPLTPPYLLASREHQPEPTVVRLGGVAIGGGGLVVVGGPCAVEDLSTLRETALAVKEAGADLLRGGAYKPRTSPYAFRGLGVEALRMLREVSRETGLPTVSEVTDPRHVEACVANVDMLQIGTRNMSNFDLLGEVGLSGHPVLLKRGRDATLSDWLLAAEYVLAKGNGNVVLCERGIRGFDPSTRNTLDLAAVPAVRARSHLPILVDPSHATGRAAFVPPMARAAVAAGADGVMVEVHVRPETARSDAEQALRPSEFRELVEDLRLLAQVTARRGG
jgi:3-deoxy-7-phosphoheptulonate synthase